MTVIKRDRGSSGRTLADGVEEFASLLEAQDEEDAVAELRRIAATLKEIEPGSGPFRAAVADLIDCFEGDHELIAYTHQRASKEWTEADQLFLASSKVLSMARRMKS